MPALTAQPNTLRLLLLLVLLGMALISCDSDKATPTVGGATPQASATEVTQPTIPTGAATTAPENSGPPPGNPDNSAPGGGTVPSEFDPGAVKKISIEPGAILRISSWGGTPEQQATRDMLAAFGAVYPEVQVKYEPEPSDYEAKLKSSFDKGSEPDVLYTNASFAHELASVGKLLKLNNALQTGGMKEADFYASLLKMFSNGGDIYGLPQDFGALAVFYNKSLVKSPPKSGWNWDDFKAFARENSTGQGETKVLGTMLPPDSARWLAFAISNGVKVIKEDGTTDINSPQAIEALQYYHSFVAEGTGAPSSDTLGVGWAGEAFVRKKVAAVIEGNWIVPFLANPGAGVQTVPYGVAPLPVLNGGGSGNLLFARAVSISTRTRFPRAAAALVLFLIGPDNQREALRRGMGLPSLVDDVENGRRTPFRDDKYFQDNPGQLVPLDAAIYGTPYYFGKDHNAIIALLNEALTAVQRGKAEPKAALDSAANAINALAKK